MSTAQDEGWEKAGKKFLLRMAVLMFLFVVLMLCGLYVARAIGSGWGWLLVVAALAGAAYVNFALDVYGKRLEEALAELRGERQ